MSRETRQRRREAALKEDTRQRRWQRFHRIIPVALIALILTGVVWHKYGPRGRIKPQSNLNQASVSKVPASYAELCAVQTNVLEKLDIALMNLLCAEGLRGAENLNVTNTLALLDEIASHVKEETERHLYKYREHPAEFNNSEGYYRMMMMVTVLQQDLGVHYNPEHIQMPWEQREPDSKFFASSQDVFLHGLARKKGGGTCSSMPVFYAAIGRRLGYPLKLVKAKGHLFARWDGRDSTFNVEGTTVGFVGHPDEYYRSWPAPFTPDEERSECYLKSLTPAQELAVFLSIRGMCLRASGEWQKSLGAMAQAFKREPQSVGYQKLFARAEHEAYLAGTLPKQAALQYAIRSLDLPGGPMRPHVAQRKALLQIMLDQGAPEREVEDELTLLKAELAPYQRTQMGALQSPTQSLQTPSK